MKRASLFIMLSGSMLLAQQQTPVEITAEPHQRLLLENDSVRAFAVTIPPREATELTRHEHNFLVVTFQDSEIASWAEGEAGVLTYRFRANDIQFYFGGRGIVGRKRKDPRGYRRTSLDSIREGREAHNQGHPTGTVRGGGTAVRVRSRKYGLCRHKLNPIYFLITSEARDLQLKRYKGTADSSSLLLLGMTTLLIG